MKYYILDLFPRNFGVKYLGDRGYMLFMIPWRNPDAEDRDQGMDGYRKMGVPEAISAEKRLARIERYSESDSARVAHCRRSRLRPWIATMHRGTR